MSFDKLTKAFLRPYYAELCQLVFEERPESVEELETTHALASARSGDKLLELRFRVKPGILMHFEAQLAGDLTMPRRAGEYVGYELQTFEVAAKEGLLPAFVVLYLDKALYKEDPGFFELKGASRFHFFVRYDVVKLWELPPERVLSMESPGLCPFVPLMRGNPEELVLRSVQKIRSAPENLASPLEKGALLTALEAMARRVMKNQELLEAILSEPELYESSVGYRKGRKVGRAEGREEGLHEGEEKALREAVLDFLAGRFGSVPDDLRSRLEAIRSRDELKRLVTAAARAADTEAFRHALLAAEG